MDFVGYKYIAMMVVVAEIAVIFLTYKRIPQFAIYAVLLSIMLKGQYLWFGRAIYAWQIAAFLGLAYLAAGQIDRVALRAGRALGFFRLSMFVYFIYTFAISILMWLVFSAEGLGEVGTQGSTSRALTQAVYFLFVIGLYGLGMWAGRHLTTIGLLRAIILIAVIAAYGAILQVLIVSFIGVNIFPIIGSDDTVRSAYIMGLTFRATSFVGEPKHLGLLMSMGLTSCFLIRLFRIRTSGRLAVHKPMVMVIALLMTLSTTGIAVTAGGIGVASVIFFRRLRGTDIAVAVGLALLLLTQIIGSGGNFAIALEGQLNKSELEVQDQSVVEGLLDNPSLILTGTGLGNIHIFAEDYLPPNFPLFRDGGYKANSGLFFVMGDSGLIGVLLLLSGPLFAMSGLAQLRRSLSIDQRKEAFSAVALILVSLMSFMLRYDVSYFLFSGFVFTRLTLLRTQVLSVNWTESIRSSPRAVAAAPTAE